MYISIFPIFPWGTSWSYEKSFRTNIVFFVSTTDQLFFFKQMRKFFTRKLWKKQDFTANNVLYFCASKNGNVIPNKSSKVRLSFQNGMANTERAPVMCWPLWILDPTDWSSHTPKKTIEWDNDDKAQWI